MKRTLLASFLVLLVPGLAACASRSTAFESGLAYMQAGRYEPAALEFDNAINLGQRTAAVYNNRGIARAHLGQVVGALGDYTQAIELSPVDPELYFNRGNAYAMLGNEDYAIQDYNRAVTLAPGYARAYFNRGTARLRLGDRAGAEQDWRYAIGIEPDPWAQAAMVRSAGLGEPAVRSAVSDIPGVVPASRVAVPAEAPAPPPQPAALPAFDTRPTAVPETGDARALAQRAVARYLDGDRAGAVDDLRAAVAIETRPERRAGLEDLLQALGPSR
jgi:tetratricopeptide (TPR) repeat protein